MTTYLQQCSIKNGRTIIEVCVLLLLKRGPPTNSRREKWGGGTTWAPATSARYGLLRKHPTCVVGLQAIATTQCSLVSRVVNPLPTVGVASFACQKPFVNCDNESGLSGRECEKKKTRTFKFSFSCRNGTLRIFRGEKCR